MENLEKQFIGLSYVCTIKPVDNLPDFSMSAHAIVLAGRLFSFLSAVDIF